MEFTLFKKNAPVGFEGRIDLPENEKEAKKWQEKNKSWWEKNPMRYDWDADIKLPEFSKEFYEEIDKRFFSDVNTYLTSKKEPFDKLINYDSLKDKDVLEIGVGNGSVAGKLAKYSKSFTGIDLTDYAFKSSTNRLKVFGLPGTIKQMDAEKMDFKDNSFDLIWTWGVIHHSSNTSKILDEMNRVLKPGGKAIVMVYYRNLWNYYFVYGFYYGILRGDLFRTKSLDKTLQRWTDGAIARYYRVKEWKKLVSNNFEVKKVRIYGSKATIMPLPAGKIKRFFMKVVPNFITRFLSNKCRMGTFLTTFLDKKDK